MGRKQSTQFKERMKSLRKFNLEKINKKQDEESPEDKIKDLESRISRYEIDLKNNKFPGICRQKIFMFKQQIAKLQLDLINKPIETKT